MEFEWDETKAASNHRKHGVTFHEAATVFGDALALTAPDPDHSENEPREITFGLSDAERLLVVVHTERNGRTRIISARRMTPGEKRLYEQS
jgi:uncharacterized DUF497 family protein